MRQTVDDYMPWLLPEFVPLHDDVTLAPLHELRRNSRWRSLPECIEQLRIKLEVSISAGDGGPPTCARSCCALLPEARLNACD